jgi:hypothetical protein
MIFRCRHFATLIAAVVLIPCLTPYISEAREIDISITVNNIPDADRWRAVLYVEAGIERIEGILPLSNSIEDEVSGPSDTLTRSRLQIPDDATAILVHGFLESSGANPRRIFLALTHHDIENERRISLNDATIRPWSDIDTAFRESFPFSIRPGLALEASEIVPSINAIRIQIARSEFHGVELSNVSWQAVYDLFRSNASNSLRSDPTVLPSLSQILSRYALGSEDEKYLGFYAEFLDNVVRSDVSTQLPNGMSSARFALNQQKNLFEKSPIRSLQSLNVMLDTYSAREIRDYEGCIELATFALSQIADDIRANPETWRARGPRFLSGGIFRAMISGTVCVQKLYATESDGQRSNTRGGAEYAASQPWGPDWMAAFVDLNDAAKDILGLEIERNPNIQDFVNWYRPSVLGLGG